MHAAQGRIISVMRHPILRLQPKLKAATVVRASLTEALEVMDSWSAVKEPFALQRRLSPAELRSAGILRALILLLVVAGYCPEEGDGCKALRIQFY